MENVVDVENWIRLEEELVEIKLFNKNEEVRTQAIERANEMNVIEEEVFEIDVFAQEDKRYRFAFIVRIDEDTQEKRLSYHGYYES